MKRDEVMNIEEYLFKSRYTKYTEGRKISPDDSYEYCKAFEDENNNIKYQVIYRFFDFGKLTNNPTLNDSYDVDIIILVGDSKFNTKLFNIDDVERFAERLYIFLNNSTLLPK